MAIERSLFLEIVKDAYSAYYSIVDDAQAPDLPLAFRADYKSRDEQYFFVKSANIWGNEKNEYAYVFSAPEIDPATAQKCLDWALQDMLPRVKADREEEQILQKLRLPLHPGLHGADRGCRGPEHGGGRDQPGRTRPGRFLSETLCPAS